jgi:uncharacterized protein YegL
MASVNLIDIGVSSEKLSSDIKDITRKLSSIDNKTINVEADTSRVNNSIKDVTNKLQQIGTIKPKIEVDTSKSEISVNNLSSKIEKLSGKNLDIKINTNDDVIDVVSDKIDNEVAKTTMEHKGDWKPLVFIMTDGIPTDDWQSGLNEFKKRKTAFTVACAAGSGADTSILKQITENVVSLDTADSASIGKFFQWVTASIGVSSSKVEDSGKDVSGINELPPPPSELNIVV